MPVRLRDLNIFSLLMICVNYTPTGQARAWCGGNSESHFTGLGSINREEAAMIPLLWSCFSLLSCILLVSAQTVLVKNFYQVSGFNSSDNFLFSMILTIKVAAWSVRTVHSPATWKSGSLWRFLMTPDRIWCGCPVIWRDKHSSFNLFDNIEAWANKRWSY